MPGASGWRGTLAVMGSKPPFKPMPLKRLIEGLAKHGPSSERSKQAAAHDRREFGTIKVERRRTD